MPSRPPPPPSDAEEASQEREMHPDAPAALKAMAQRLLVGHRFSVNRVWYKLTFGRSTGYFGIYWFCRTLHHSFALHCTLTQWDIHEWMDSYVGDWGVKGPDFKALKLQFDDWIRLPGKDDRRPHAARLLSWSYLDVHDSTPVPCNDGYHWRCLLFLRKGEDQQYLYDLKNSFETIYSIRNSHKTVIHYSLEAVCEIPPLHNMD